MKYIISLEAKQLVEVGELDVFASRGSASYQFIYRKNWVEKEFPLAPDLPLVADYPYVSDSLFGFLQDSAPDRWGRRILQRAQAGYLSGMDYLLSVNDGLRMGALRIREATASQPFLAADATLFKRSDLAALEKASWRFEKAQESDADLQRLIAAGTAVGGARPKVSVMENGELGIVKLAAVADEERVEAWEAVMLDLARSAGIQTAKHQLINPHSERPILFLPRFDRQQSQRIPFASAMTMAGVNYGEAFSYSELAGVVARVAANPQQDNLALWTRMTFNALTGNTDDHLRNHAFLRGEKGWQLAPAYDLNPNPLPIAARRHALGFLPDEHQPSLHQCLDIAPLFNLEKWQMNCVLQALARSLRQWRTVAKKNGLNDSEIRRMETAFEHRESERLFSRYG